MLLRLVAPSVPARGAPLLRIPLPRRLRLRRPRPLPTLALRRGVWQRLFGR